MKGEKRDLLEYSIADLVAIAYQRGGMKVSRLMSCLVNLLG